MSAPSITFGPRANKAVVSVHTLGVLADILTAAGLDACLITSTSRTPAEQARVMYQNVEAHGVVAQKKLYAAPGRAVIDEYARSRKAGKSQATTIANMEVKIKALGPSKVSRHCADPAVLNVVDVAPSSILDAREPAFVAAVQKAIAAGTVSKLLMPPSDPAYHLEVPQPPATPPA